MDLKRRRSRRLHRLFGLLAAVILLGWASPISAQTTVNGGQLGDTTWTESNSPYVVKGDVIIQSGKTLSIEQGVEVQLEASDFLETGRNTSLVEIRIEGALEVQGTEQKPVLINGTSNQRFHWHGLIVTSSASNVDIDHLRLRDAGDGIRLETTNQVEINDSTFWENSGNGIAIYSGQPTLDAVVTRSNRRHGIAFHETGGADISNAIVRDNETNGVYVDCGTNQQSPVVFHSSVSYQNDSDGVREDCDDASKTTTIRNSIVAKNGFDGVDQDGSSTVEVDHSNVWGNGTDDFEGPGIVRSDNISARPLFENPPGDLRLQQTSLCIDSGTDNGAPSRDFDGKQRPIDGDTDGDDEYDMGAFEYGQGAVCGNGTVEDGESCDDGSENGDYGKCAEDCSGPGPHCGDGTVDGPEECDDGNTMDGDGCSSTCTVESNGDSGLPDASGDVGSDDDAGGSGGGDVSHLDSGNDDSADTSGGGSSTEDASSENGGGADSGGTGFDTTANGGGGGSDDSSGASGGGSGCGCASSQPRIPGSLLFVLIFAGVTLVRLKLEDG